MNFKSMLSTLSLITAIALHAVEVTPLVPGESIISVRLSRWQYKPLTPNTSFYRERFYKLSATSKLKVKARGKLSRQFRDFSCQTFDEIVLHFSPRRKVAVTMIALTDAGEKKISVPAPEQNQYMEVILPLDRAKKIKELSIIIEAGKAGQGVWASEFRFLSLRNHKKYADYSSFWELKRNMDWSGYLESDIKYSPVSFVFAKGEFELYRQECLKSHAIKAKLVAMSNQIAENKLVDPQKMVAVYNGKNTTVAINKNAASLYSHRLAYYALTGKILHSKIAMQYTARYMLAMAFMGTWARGTIGYWTGLLPGSVFGTFGAAYRSERVATALDLCNEALSPSGKALVYKSLINKGLTPTMHSLWGRRTGGNQGVLYTGGKLTALLACERYYSKTSTYPVKPYTQLAKNELDTAMNKVFNSDGSYSESTSYLFMTLKVALFPYVYYSNARNLPLREVISENIKKSECFGQLICSTNPRRRVFAYGQTRSLEVPFTQAAFITLCCPNTIWRKLLPSEKEIAAQVAQSLPYDPINWQLAKRLVTKPKEDVFKALTLMKSIGVVNSYRKSGGKWIKIVLIGLGEHRGKTDYDCGNFYIEYAGDTYAEELPGLSNYLYKESYFHNMLIPSGTKRPAGQSKKYYYKLHRNNQCIVPAATGDEKSFRADITGLEKAWGPYFEKYSRSIDSPTPETVTITDSFELDNNSGAAGVDFTWITGLKTELNDNKIIITGDFGSKCELTWNRGCTAKIEHFKPGKLIAMTRMGYPDDREFSRILIHRDGKQGLIIVKAKFRPKK